MTGPNDDDARLDDVITPEHDRGVPHDRGAHGGSPDVPDGLLERQADLDRQAAGLDGPEAPPAAD